MHTQNCIQTFQDYFTLLLQCPKSYHENHRINMYEKWAKFLLENQNTKSCDIVFEEIKVFLESKAHDTAHIVSIAYTLDTFYKENFIQVNKLFEELNMIRNRDPPHTVEASYNQAKKNMDSFLNKEKDADKALRFVLAGELLLLNRILLTSEIAAQKSGNWLIKLTSREGDWFLDDLLLHSTKAVEMVNHIPLKADDDSR